jgi:hypothetical protein
MVPARKTVLWQKMNLTQTTFPEEDQAEAVAWVAAEGVAVAQETGTVSGVATEPIH